MGGISKGFKKAREATFDVIKSGINPLDSGNRKDAKEAFSSENLILANAFDPSLGEEAPVPPDPIPVPNPDDPLRKARAQRRRLKGNTGYESTVLTGLGG